MVLSPHFVGDDLSRRWLSPYVAPPRNKTVRKDCRHALLDGVLAALRCARDASLRSFLGHGEGGLIAAALLSAEIREAAFRERRVQETEAIELETVAASLQYVLLLAPHAFPIRTYAGMLREYVPEIVSIIPPDGVRVHVVVPSKESTSAPSLDVAASLLGATHEVID